jgi:hypothetical protein
MYQEHPSQVLRLLATRVKGHQLRSFVALDPVAVLRHHEMGLRKRRRFRPRFYLPSELHQIRTKKSNRVPNPAVEDPLRVILVRPSVLKRLLRFSIRTNEARRIRICSLRYVIVAPSDNAWYFSLSNLFAFDFHYSRSEVQRANLDRRKLQTRLRWHRHSLFSINLSTVSETLPSTSMSEVLWMLLCNLLPLELDLGQAWTLTNERCHLTNPCPCLGAITPNSFWVDLALLEL